MHEIDDAVAAAAFRRLVDHLRHRSDAQNVDLMGLAGFCRNCLADWVAEAGAEQGKPLDRDEAREAIYGMPYAEWKAKPAAGHARAAGADGRERRAQQGDLAEACAYQRVSPSFPNLRHSRESGNLPSFQRGRRSRLPAKAKRFPLSPGMT